ncbi:hypothetical protein IC007_1838 [Sulfuracidifex tepidarius]|uniref:Uncharacterized protein n=1 Tax=Sulfuracidifex tepidarius TaxID=1294262 RepID=A0A510E451_9CREN|nr:hypothetical protein IC007_1838 [Sulfuracidifex tepidarius]
MDWGSMLGLFDIVLFVSLLLLGTFAEVKGKKAEEE